MHSEAKQSTGANRHKAREAATQMLFAADVHLPSADELITRYWRELGDDAADEPTRDFTRLLVSGTLDNLQAIDDKIRSRAEHWRIERMAIVDRNVLRLAVFEMLYTDTPGTVAINEALEIARQYSTYESTQFINGLLDAIRLDIDGERGTEPETSPVADA